MNHVRMISAAFIGAALFPVTLSAQSYNDSWSAFSGCWHAQGAAANERLCIEPEGNGARLMTVINGVRTGETRLVADDRARDVSQDDCRGSERARWSNDGRRLYLNAEMTCGPTRRRSSGIMAFTDPGHWVSVQAVTVDGETSTRRTVYEAVDNGSLALRDVRSWAASAPTSSAADDASNFVDEAAVDQWLETVESDVRVSGGSALDMVTRGRSTVVVERPVYVDRTVYVERPVIRYVQSCWDPFWGGYFGVTQHVGIVVNYGCGYDYYRPYVVRHYPRYTYPPTIVIHNNRDRDYHWYHNSDRDRDRYNNERDRSRVTRDGYTRDKARPRESSTQRESTPPRTRSSGPVIERVTRDNPARESSSREKSGSTDGRTARRRN